MDFTDELNVIPEMRREHYAIYLYFYLYI